MFVASRSLASKLASTRLRSKGPLLTLDQFIQRQRVLSFYRQVVRAILRIPASSTRNEMRQFARVEFERNKAVKDPGHIRYLISTGKTQMDSMMRYVDELALQGR